MTTWTDPKSRPVTEDDPLTLDEEYTEQREAALPEWARRLAIAAAEDQFDACPSYLQQNAQRFAQER